MRSPVYQWAINALKTKNHHTLSDLENNYIEKWSVLFSSEHGVIDGAETLTIIFPNLITRVFHIQLNTNGFAIEYDLT